MSSPTTLTVLEESSVPPLVVITDEQVDLIKRTIAEGATDAELKLFFYDCKRRGVHPLDRLIHFTKRGGKYTPVTAIDMFRARAAATREHMGTDDAVFAGKPMQPDFRASVTVYRMVQGEKCPFTATARWSEYCPDGDKLSFMWKKMPHGQLGKCCEALALRKAFPQELDGLHTFEEMDQAGNDAPTGNRRIQPPQKKNGNTHTVPGPLHVVKVEEREAVDSTGKKLRYWSVFFSDGKIAGTNSEDMAVSALDLSKAKTVVTYEVEPGKKEGTFKLIELSPTTAERDSGEEG